MGVIWPDNIDQLVARASGSGMQQFVQDNPAIQLRHMDIGGNFGNSFVVGNPTPPLKPFVRFGPKSTHSQLSAPPTQWIGVQSRPKELPIF